MSILHIIGQADGWRLTLFGVGTVFVALSCILVFIVAFSRFMASRFGAIVGRGDSLPAPHSVTDRYVYDKASDEDVAPEVAELLRRARDRSAQPDVPRAVSDHYVYDKDSDADVNPELSDVLHHYRDEHRNH